MKNAGLERELSCLLGGIFLRIVLPLPTGDDDSHALVSRGVDDPPKEATGQYRGRVAIRTIED